MIKRRTKLAMGGLVVLAALAAAVIGLSRRDKQLIDWRALDSNYGGRIEVYPDGSYLDRDDK